MGRSAPERAATWRRRALIVLVAAHVLLPVVVMTRPGFGHDNDARRGDTARYLAIGEAGGTPGRDFAVEYPPLAVLGMRALATNGLHGLVARNTVVQWAADGALAVALLALGGETALLAYLALSVLLLPFLLGEFDLFVVALAVVGLAVAHRRAIGGGALVAASAFVKPFTLVVVPILAVERRGRALVASLVTLALGGAGWLVWSGTRGIRDVVTYRGSRGWHAESTPGLVLALARGLHSRYEGGTYRVGAPPAAVNAILVLGVLGATVAWWWSGRNAVRAADSVGVVGALAIWLAGATLFSPQFIAWIVPFVALCFARGARRCAVVGSAAVALTVLRLATAPLYAPDGAAVRTVLALRSVTFVALVAAAVADRRDMDAGVLPQARSNAAVLGEATA